MALFESEEIKVGGESIERPRLPTSKADGTPLLYSVEVKSYRKKPGRPNDQGQETFFYSWTFEVIEGLHKGSLIYGATNDQARRSYTTKEPMKLLQFIMAIVGREPEKGTTIRLDDLVGQRLRVELKDKPGEDGPYQTAVRFYPFRASPTGTPSTPAKETGPWDGVDPDGGPDGL